MDDSYSLDSGRIGAWTSLNLRAVKRLKEEVRKRKKHWMSAELADGWWVMQTWRAGEGRRGKGRCKGRTAGRRMRWIIGERPSRSVGLDETWWEWLKGLGLKQWWVSCWLILSCRLHSTSVDCRVRAILARSSRSNDRMRNSSSWLLVIVRKGRRSGGALWYQREETGRKFPVGYQEWRPG